MVRIIKPDVVGHVSTTTGSDRKTVTRRRHAIYSVDVQPGAHRCSFLCSMLGTITHYCYSLIHVWNRLATAGGDCSVRLWSLPTLLATVKVVPATRGKRSSCVFTGRGRYLPVLLAGIDR